MAVFRRLRSTWLDRATRSDQGSSPTVPSARTGPAAVTDVTAVPEAAGTAAPASLDPAAAPRCFGPVPNHAYSPLPALDPTGAVVTGTGIRKFVDPLPGLGALGRTPSGRSCPSRCRTPSVTPAATTTRSG